VNLEHAQSVAKRHAFGSDFEPSDQDPQRVESVASGRISMHPHPVAEYSEPIDWAYDPFGQPNWCFQFHTLRWLDPIRRMAATGDFSRMDLWDRIVLDWSANNPPEAPGSKWAWVDMGDAMRAMTILFGLPYSRHQKELVSILKVHGNWLRDSDNIGRANHALHQHIALFLLGSALQEAEWKSTAERRLREHFELNYDNDGLNAEGAPAYWKQNLIWGRQIERRLELEGAPTDFLAGLFERNLQTILHSTRPDGYLESLGDTCNETFTFSSTPQARYVKSSGAEGTAPSELSVVYEGGYAFGRTGWGEARREFSQESFYSLAFGGAKVHGHKDGGALTFAPMGVPLLIDSGKFAYTNHWMRNYVKSRAAHNTVTLEDATVDPDSVVSLRSHRVTPNIDYFGLADPSYKDVDLHRNVVFARNFDALVVVDYVRSDSPVIAHQNWHLAPDAAAIPQENAVRVQHGGENFTIRWLGADVAIDKIHAQADPPLGWMSPDWNEILATDLIRATRTGRHIRFVTVISPESVRVDYSHSLDTGSLDIHLAQDPAYETLRVHGNEIFPLSTDTSSSMDEPGSAPAIQVEAAERIVSNIRSGSRTVNHNPFPTLDYGYSAAVQDGDFPERHQLNNQNRHSLKPGALVPWQGSSTLPVVIHEDLSDIPQTTNPAIHVYLIGPLALPALFLPGEGPLVVGFHGALNRGHTVLPKFERATSLREFGSPTLIFSDPTLDLSKTLKLGWFIGSRSADLPPAMGTIVSSFASAMSIPPTQILLTGSSGGGFAALQTSSSVAGSHVVAFNPQTNVRSYFPRFSRDAIETIFGSDATFDSIPRRRWDAATRLLEAANPPTAITYITNTGDGHHAASHEKPFMEACSEGNLRTHIRRVEVDWGPRHASPSTEYFSEIMLETISRM